MDRDRFGRESGCRSDHFRALWPATAFETVCLSLLNEKLSFVSQKQTVGPQREVAQVSRVGLAAGSVFQRDNGAVDQNRPGGINCNAIT